MRLKAVNEVEYAGKSWAPGTLFDALELDARELINRGYAIPFNLEDPSSRDAGDVLRNLAPSLAGVTLDPDSATATAAGGPGTVQVSVADGLWMVTVPEGVDWVTITSPTEPQTDDGTVEYEVAINPAEERTVALKINAASFTITQEAGPPVEMEERHSRKKSRW